MLFAEPSKTRYDVTFGLGPIPVRVHPWFWIVTVLLALGGPTTPREIAIWVGAVFVSILVHELGHALAFRRYGWRPRITLHGMGGLTSVDPAYGSQEPRGNRMILISAAGPLAGFALAGLVVGAVLLLGYRTPFLVWTLGQGRPISNATAFFMVHDLIFIGVAWGLVNLLPVHPLDGGQIAREILSRSSRSRGLLRSLRLSIITGGLVAAVGLFWFRSAFVAVLFGYLGYLSYVLLRRERGLGPPRALLPTRSRGSWFDRRKKARQRRDVERETARLVRKQEDLEDAPHADPQVAQEARELLGTLTDHILQNRAARPPADSKDSKD